MPAQIDEIVKRRVIQQWLAGEAREKIIADNNIGAGTIGIIVDEHKAGLDNFDLDSFRELMLEAKKRAMSPANLASFFRLYNFFRGSGAKENEIESFITNINSGYILPGKAIELINQIYNISKSESFPPDQLPDHIKEQLEEKQKIDEQIKEADAILQTKNVKAKAINEYVKLSEKLGKHGLSTQDVNKLVKLIVNAKRYGFDAKKFVGKLSNIKELEKKEKGLRGSCLVLSKKIAKHKDIVPLTEEIAALQIGINELIALKVGINEAANHYNLSPLAATLRLIEDIKKYNKINRLNRELSSLYLQKYTLDQICSRQNEALVNLAKLKSYGLTEDRILQLNNMLLENNGYKDMKLNNT